MDKGTTPSMFSQWLNPANCPEVLQLIEKLEVDKYAKKLTTPKKLR